jgi:hypothetical protein
MIDTDFQTFYLILVEKLKLDEKDFTTRLDVIEHIHQFRRDIQKQIKDAYNRGLLEGGYAMQKIHKEYEHRSASP